MHKHIFIRVDMCSMHARRHVTMYVLRWFCVCKKQNVFLKLLVDDLWALLLPKLSVQGLIA